MTPKSRLRSIVPVALAAALISASIAAAPASAAKKSKAPSYIAAANGVAGVSSVIRVNAPRYKGRSVNVVASQPGSPTATLPVALDAAGNGAVTWTPTAAGSWAIQGQGDFAAAKASSVAISPVATESTITVAAQGQADAPMDVFATVTAVAGTLPPEGSVSFTTSSGTALDTAPLVAGTGASSTARISWTPNSEGYFSLVATYNPAAGTAGTKNANASTATQTVFVVETQPLLTIRVPSTLRVGTPTSIASVVNNLSLSGSAAMTVNVNGTVSSIMPSTSIQSGVASATWTPSDQGPQIISAAFSSTNTNTSAVQSQPVNVLGPKPADGLSVGPAGQGAWPVGINMTLPIGAKVPVAVATQSGAPVTMTTSGACLVSGATLFPIAKSGSCTLTVTSSGTAEYAQTEATYTFSIQRG